MGDKIVIKKVEYLDYTGSEWGDKRLYQIDLYNENKDEHYRTFIDSELFEEMLKQAKGTAVDLA